MRPEIIGWASSIILLVTLAAQTRKLYQTRTTKGVSNWLYIGELGASAGFTAYSALLHNAVYIAANALGVVTSLLGLAFFIRNRRVERRGVATKRSLAPAISLPTPTR
jgi:MtN3 and saliva related transmembrane protein